MPLKPLPGVGRNVGTAAASRPKARPELDTKMDTPGRQRAVQEFNLQTVRRPNPHNVGMGPRQLILPPARHLTPSEQHLGEYLTAASIFGDRIEGQEEVQDLKDASLSLHEARDDFDFGPSNVLSALDKCDHENGRRSKAARSPDEGVLQRHGESMNVPKNVRMNRITRAATCGDMTSQVIYRHLHRLPPDRKLYGVDYRLADHNWAEQTRGPQRLALDLWHFRVFQARHGRYCQDMDQSKSFCSYTSADLPGVEADIEHYANRFRPREFAFWQKVTKFRKQNMRFEGLVQVTPFDLLFAAEVQDNMTHLDDRTRTRIKNHKARSNRKNFSEQKEKIALDRNNQIHAVAVARTLRPDLSIKDAAREAPALVEGAKNLLKPHEW